MLVRPIYYGDKVTESPHIHNGWEPKHPWDIHPESRNAEIFSLTHELNDWKPLSEAFEVFCIVKSLPTEYSPCVFKFIETWKEPTLIELYEVMCKVEDDLRINPPDITNKRTTDDKENDEKVIGRTEGFFYELVTKKNTALPKCDYCQNIRHKIGKCFEYIRDLKIAKRERELPEEGIPCSCDDCGSTSSSKEDEAKASSKA
ncbi:hypothetical protein Tco_0913179 [Tanacetum coccineum]